MRTYIWGGSGQAAPLALPLALLKPGSRVGSTSLSRPARSWRSTPLERPAPPVARRTSPAGMTKYWDVNLKIKVVWYNHQPCVVRREWPKMLKSRADKETDRRKNEAVVARPASKVRSWNPAGSGWVFPSRTKAIQILRYIRGKPIHGTT